MATMMVFISASAILITAGFIVLYVRDSVFKNSTGTAEGIVEEAFCDIDLEYLVRNMDQSNPMDIEALKQKIQKFKQRNRFYKM